MNSRKDENVKKIKSGLPLLHSEWPKLHRVLAVLSAIGLNRYVVFMTDLSITLNWDSVGSKVTLAGSP